MVLGGNFDLPGSKIFDRLISTPVAEFQLKSWHPGPARGVGDRGRYRKWAGSPIMNESFQLHRLPVGGRPDRLKEKCHPVPWLQCVGGGGRRHHHQFKAGMFKLPQDIKFDAKIKGNHRPLCPAMFPDSLSSGRLQLKNCGLLFSQ